MPPVRFALVFWRWDLSNCLPGLVLDCDLPYVGLPSSQGYRCEPLTPGLFSAQMKSGII
jgi:hypothetical protein